MSKLTRREFVKLSAVSLLGFTLPYQIGQLEIVIVDYEVDDELFKSAIKVGKPKVEGDRVVANVDVDMKIARQAITFIDSTGKRWSWNKLFELAAKCGYPVHDLVD